MASVALTPAQAYSKEEWDKKRTIITQLYREEAQSLHSVRVVLAQHHSFRPTAAMLKKRIQKWDLDRKHKEADMLFVVQSAFKREAQGKKTVFLIRGRIVTLEDVEKYFKRKGVHDLKSLARDANTAVPTTRIDCHTPGPFESSEWNAIHDSNSPKATTNLDLQYEFSTGNTDFDTLFLAVPDPNQVQTVSLTGTLGYLEQLLHFGCSYYDGMFDNPNWRTKEATFELGSLEAFYHHMLDGQFLLERDCIVAAFEEFDCAFGQIHTILEQQPLLFLPYLYHIIMQVSEAAIRTVEIQSHLMRFISRMAESCSPQLIPVKASLSLLQSLTVEERCESSRRAFMSILDHVHSQFENDAPNELELQSDVCALSRPNSTLASNFDKYKLTSIAFWRLAEHDTMHELSLGSPARILQFGIGNEASNEAVSFAKESRVWREPDEHWRPQNDAPKRDKPNVLTQLKDYFYQPFHYQNASLVPDNRIESSKCSFRIVQKAAIEPLTHFPLHSQYPSAPKTLN